MLSFQDCVWDSQTQQTLLAFLKENADPKYLAFNHKIVQPRLPMLGVRAGTMQKLATQISKGDWENYIEHCPHAYYEQVLLHGMVLGSIRCDFDRLCELLEDFIPWISDWAVCDMTCNRLKAFARNPESGFSFACRCLQPYNPWKTRFGLVLMLSHFVNERYISELLEQSISADRLSFSEEKQSGAQKADAYFVRMANAWLISICFVKFKDQTLELLKRRKWSAQTTRFALQKIRDSHRVSLQDKQQLKAIFVPR